MLRSLVAGAALASGANGAILVTGATGRIGFDMYKSLKEAQQEVRALSRTAEKAKQILGCDKCDESEGIYLGDVTDKDSLANALKGADTLVIAVGAHGNEPDDVVDKIEWDGVKNQVEALVSDGKEGKRVVLFSSMSTSKPHNHVLVDKAKAEKYIIAQGISYSIVKPCGLSEDEAGDRELLIGHDDVADANDWFNKGFYMVPRADVVSVATAAILSPPSDNMRFDVCAKLAGSGPADVKKAVEEAGKSWTGPTQSVIV